MILPHSQSPAPVPALPGITRRTLVHGTTMMICEFSLKAGSNLPLHSHPHEQAGYVATGKIRLTVGSETRELGPGGTYYAPPNVPHGAAVLEDAIVVDTFSPPREDYLPSQSKIEN